MAAGLEKVMFPVGDVMARGSELRWMAAGLERVTFFSEKRDGRRPRKCDVLCGRPDGHGSKKG